MGQNMLKFAARVDRYRQELAEITERYDRAEKELDKFRGSEGYTTEISRLKAERKQALDVIRVEHRPLLMQPLEAMRGEVEKKSRKLNLPSSEQMILLQLFQMRSNVTKAELDRAASSMQDCPAGLAVLEDIGKKCGHIGCHYTDGFDPDSALEYVGVMEANVGYLLSAERHNATYIPGNVMQPGQNNSPDDIRRIQLTRDFQGTEDCCRVFGCIASDRMSDFERIVEPSEAK